MAKYVTIGLLWIPFPFAMVAVTRAFLPGLSEDANAFIWLIALAASNSLLFLINAVDRLWSLVHCLSGALMGYGLALQISLRGQSAGPLSICPAVLWMAILFYSFKYSQFRSSDRIVNKDCEG